jgi:hypothetical protein
VLWRLGREETAAWYRNERRLAGALHAPDAPRAPQAPRDQ